MNSQVALENITESGGVPESRLNDAKAVLDMVLNMIRADDYRASTRAKVKGLVDGNAPYSANELKRTGQSFRTNVNFREGESFLNMGMSAFFDVFAEVPTYATVRIKHGDVNDSEVYSRIITEEFDKLQKKDGSFDYLMQLSQHEMVLYGIGPLVFEDTMDWRCKPVKASDLLLPDGTKSNVDDWPMCVVRSTYQVHELYSYIKNSDAAANAGWNVAEAKKAIIKAHPDSQNSRGNSWESYQQQIRNNDLSFSAKCDTVRVAHVFYREFPTSEHPKGAISHCIVDERNSGNEFLFRKVNRYSKWSEAVHCMYYDKGDGTHHSVKGMGIKMFSALELKNRLKCSLIDAAMARTAIHMEPDSPNALNRINVIQMGPYSIIPPGFKVTQTNSAGVLDAPLAVERELEGLMQANLSQYRQRLEKGGNPRTATEIDAIVAQQSVLGKTQLNRYYTQLDTFFAERYRRVSKSNLTKDVPGADEALDFQKRCIERGCPKECLDKVEFVQATRTAGRGSPMERRAIMNQLMSIITMLPETGRKHVLEDHIASLAGYHTLNRYYPTPEEDVDTQEQQQEAAIENASFKSGAVIPIAGGDNHAIHTEVHLQGAGEAAQAAQQGAGDLAEIGAYLNAIIQHTTAHLGELSMDETRKELVKAYAEQLGELQKIVDQIAEEVARQQEEAAQQQQEAQEAQMQMQALQGGQDPKDQLATMRAERDESRRDMKTKNDMERKSMKTQQDLALKDAKAAQKLLAQ
tara:strand:+ start:3596 stop:5839 length:2244 start_codon:yes stop_codon:yes gene_type:complete